MPEENEAIPFPSLGDVNDDGSLNVQDVVSLVVHILEYQTLEGQGFQNADVNQDENIDVMDVVSLVNLILGND